MAGIFTLSNDDDSAFRVVRFDLTQGGTTPDTRDAEDNQGTSDRRVGFGLDRMM